MVYHAKAKIGVEVLRFNGLGNEVELTREDGTVATYYPGAVLTRVY